MCSRPFSTAAGADSAGIGNPTGGFSPLAQSGHTVTGTGSLKGPYYLTMPVITGIGDDKTSDAIIIATGEFDNPAMSPRST